MRKWVPVWEDLDGEGGEAFISTGIALGVRVETRIKYRAAYARFIDFLVRNNLAFNAASLGRFFCGLVVSRAQRAALWRRTVARLCGRSEDSAWKYSRQIRFWFGR